MKKEILYPLIKDIKGSIVSGIIGGAGSGLATAEPVAGIIGFVLGFMAEKVSRISIDKVHDIQNPFRKYFDFHTDDFVLMRGYKKDKNKQLVTMNFDPIVKIPWAKPEIDRNDREISEKIASMIGLYEYQKLYDQNKLEKKENDFMNFILKKDILSVGGPIPIDPLYEVMIKKDVLPCNYELKKPLIYSSDETGIPNKTIYKYEIVTPKGILEPKWNELNYGIITCVDKKLIFPESEKGILINFSGCQWFGTYGACNLFLEKEKMENTIRQIAENVGKIENFQAIISVPIDKETKMIKENEVNIEPELIFKVR